MTTLKRASRRSPGRPEGLAGVRVLLRSIPQVSQILEEPALAEAIARHGRPLALALVREALEAIRSGVRSGGLGPPELAGRLARLPAWIQEEARARTASTLRPVINATGVLLHTNPGRAILSEAAVRRVLEVARAYTTLEYDLARGRRGPRSSHLERLVSLVFPGKAVHVVSNNAAATLLALNPLGEGKEAIVSRG